MSETARTQIESVEAAYERGRAAGLGTAAVALAVVAYVNLLGIEKSLLAITLAVVALRHVSLSKVYRTRTWVALVLASIHATTVVVVVVLYADKLTVLGRRVIELYHSLS